MLKISLPNPIYQFAQPELWLDANNAASITQADGVVSEWRDTRANGRSATATGTGQPTYTVDSLGGKPVLQFNGSTNFMSFDGTFLAGTNYSVFAVERRASGKSNNYFISGNGAATLNNNLSLGYRLNGRSAFTQTSNGYDTVISNFSTATPRINFYRFDSAVGKNLYINGVSQTLSAIAGGTPSQTTGLVSNNNAQIGRHFASSYYFGDIAEIMIYKRALSDGEMETITQYLKNKWGI